MHTYISAVLLGLAAATATAHGQTTLRIATDHTDLVLQTDDEGASAKPTLARSCAMPPTWTHWRP